MATLTDSEAEQQTYDTPGNAASAPPSAEESVAARNKEIADLENAYRSPSAAESGSAKLADAQSLSSQEKDPDGGSGGDRLGKGYTGKSGGSLSNNNRLFSSGPSRRWLFAGGAGLSMAAGIAALLIIFFSSFGLVNFSQAISEYAFIRIARQSSVVSRSVLSEGIGQQASRRFSAVYDPLKSRYAGAREITTNNYSAVRNNTWGRFDALRYDKILKNLGAGGGVEFNYKLLKDGTVGLDTIAINGKTLELPPKTELTWRQRIVPFASDIVELDRQSTIVAQLMPEIEQAMGTGTGSLMNRLARYRALKAALSDAGITRAGYKIALEKYKETRLGSAAKTKISARALELRDRAERTIAARGGGVSTVTASTAGAVEETLAAQKEVLASEAELERIASSGGTPERVVSTASSSAEAASGASLSSMTGKLGALNTAYAIALPLCMIYEGSMVSPNSAQTIDSNTAAAMQTYNDIAGKADNLKTGAKDGQDPVALAELTGATTEALGDVTTFYGSGSTSQDVIGTQADAMGSYGNYGGYSLIDTFLSPLGLDQGTISGLLNEGAGGGCAAITNPWVAGGTAAVSVVLKVVTGIFTGGGSVVAEEAAVQGIKTGIFQLAKNYVKRAVVGKIAARQGVKWATTKFTEKELTEATLMRILWGNKLSLAAQTSKDSFAFGVKLGALYESIEGVTYLSKLLVASRAGQTYSPLAQNNELQTQAAVGAVAEANLLSKATGGRALTAAELSQSRVKDIASLNETDKTKSLYARVFAPDNYRSLSNRTFASLKNQAHGGVSGAVSGLVASASNPLSSVWKLGLDKFAPNAYAWSSASSLSGDSYYHIVQFGFSEDELALMQTAQYSLKENERVLAENPEKYQALHDKYLPCREETMGALLAGKLIARDDKGNIIDDKNVLCSPINLSYKNPEFGDLVFRERALTFQNEQLTALEDLTAVAERQSTPTTNTSESIDRAKLFESSVNVACADGTRTIQAIQNGYREGAIVKLRLCAIPGFKSAASESSSGTEFAIPGANGDVLVNSRVSGAWLSLFMAAKNAGVTLTADSGWRSMAKQTELWNSNGQNPALVAPPGTSPHQMGLAIDFGGVSGKDAGAQTCAARVKDTLSPTWRWLEKNAPRFGFKQYSAEAWHWDPLETSNRCGSIAEGV